MTYALVLLIGMWLGWHLHRHWLKRQKQARLDRAPLKYITGHCVDIRAGTTRCRAYTEVG